MQNKHSTLKVFIIALIFLVAGFFLGQSWQKPSPVTPAEQPEIEIAQTISFTLDYGDRVAFSQTDVIIEKEENLFALTKRLVAAQNLQLEYDDSNDWGVFIKRIGEKSNGDDNQFWQYWINDKQLQVAADKYQIQPGDSILWKFTTSEL